MTLVARLYAFNEPKGLKRSPNDVQSLSVLLPVPLCSIPANAIVNQILFFFNFQNECFFFIAYIILATILVVLAKNTSSGPKTLAKI